MGKPKTSTTSRRTHNRRSHDVLELARKVNGKSPVKAFTTRRESGKKLTAAIKGVQLVETAKPAKKATGKTAPAKKSE